MTDRKLIVLTATGQSEMPAGDKLLTSIMPLLTSQYEAALNAWQAGSVDAMFQASVKANEGDPTMIAWRTTFAPAGGTFETLVSAWMQLASASGASATPQAKLRPRLPLCAPAPRHKPSRMTMTLRRLIAPLVAGVLMLLAALVGPARAATTMTNASSFGLCTVGALTKQPCGQIGTNWQQLMLPTGDASSATISSATVPNVPSTLAGIIASLGTWTSGGAFQLGAASLPAFTGDCTTSVGAAALTCTAFGRLAANNTWANVNKFNGGFTYAWFNSSTYPSVGGIGVAMSSNFSGGYAETNFWNTWPTAGMSFEFEQMTGAGVATKLLRIPITGGVTLPKLSVAPSTASGTGWANVFFLAGTTSGSGKICYQAGTTTAVTCGTDNIGGGF